MLMDSILLPHSYCSFSFSFSFSLLCECFFEIAIFYFATVEWASLILSPQNMPPNKFSDLFGELQMSSWAWMAYVLFWNAFEKGSVCVSVDVRPLVGIPNNIGFMFFWNLNSMLIVATRIHQEKERLPFAIETFRKNSLENQLTSTSNVFYQKNRNNKLKLTFVLRFHFTIFFPFHIYFGSLSQYTPHIHVSSLDITQGMCRRNVSSIGWSANNSSSKSKMLHEM